MEPNSNKNLATEAAAKAIKEVFDHIDKNTSFIMEAGAGAGKTYSLKQALHHVIDLRGAELLRNNQQVACITYTEAATDELRKDLDNHPIAWVSTIHAFCWELLKDFQPVLRQSITELPRWHEKIAEMEGIGKRKITYDIGFRSYDDNKLSLAHDDIPALTAILMNKPKFCSIFISRFPILFIDEYQDTNKELMESLKKNFLDKNRNLQLGLFGDHWQRIYDDVCGEVTHSRLPVIKKHANFRSNKRIVDCLNRMRPELEQFSNNDDSGSDVRVYHTNDWNDGERGKGPHHIGSLPDDVARRYFESTKAELERDGWDLSVDKTKMLLLTNSMLAKEQGYEELLNCFPYPYTDQCLRKEDDYIKFFAEIIEPASDAYESKKYGQMFSALGSKIHIRSHADKVNWAKDMTDLIEIRKKGTIGQVIDLLLKTKRPQLPERVLRREEALKEYLENPSDDIPEELKKKMQRLIDLKSIPYSQIISLVKYIDGKTPFSTKHKVKGAEFENVLVVFSQGWSKYNFNTMLQYNTIENVPNSEKDKTFFENNRNLFYVVCSRPQKRLALLFTHELSEDAISTLNSWFGPDSVRSTV